MMRFFLRRSIADRGALGGVDPPSPAAGAVQERHRRHARGCRDSAGRCGNVTGAHADDAPACATVPRGDARAGSVGKSIGDRIWPGAFRDASRCRRRGTHRAMLHSSFAIAGCPGLGLRSAPHARACGGLGCAKSRTRRFAARVVRSSRCKHEHGPDASHDRPAGAFAACRWNDLHQHSAVSGSSMSQAMIEELGRGRILAAWMFSTRSRCRSIIRCALDAECLSHAARRRRFDADGTSPGAAR